MDERIEHIKSISVVQGPRRYHNILYCSGGSRRAREMNYIIIHHRPCHRV
jgi:hypothetical protein